MVTKSLSRDVPGEAKEFSLVKKLPGTFSHTSSKLIANFLDFFISKIKRLSESLGILSVEKGFDVSTSGTR